MATVRKHLVLYIGFHQTGSAAVHESLYAARVGLRDHRVVYPQPLTAHPSHLDLATALGFNPRDELRHLDRASVIERYRRLIADCAPGAIVVLASEEFCLGNYLPQAMENLRVFLDKLDADVTVSATIREPLPFLLDVYHTELRDTDAAAPFDQWLESFDVTGADFEGRLEVWRQMIGPSEELRVRWVDDDLNQSDGDNRPGRRSLDGILEDCEVDPAAVPLVDPPGVNLHPKLVEPLLAVRRHVVDGAERRRLLEALLEISPLLEPVPDPVAVHLDPTARAAAENRFSPTDAQIDPSRGEADHERQTQ